MKKCWKDEEMTSHKRKSVKKQSIESGNNSVSIGRDVKDSTITHKNITNNYDIDLSAEQLNENLGQLNDTLYDIYERNTTPFDSVRNDFSREILETVIISIATGIGLIGIWPYTSGLISYVPIPIALISAMVFSVIRITHLGFRHSFIVSFWIGAIFTGWIYFAEQYTAIEYVVAHAPVVAALGNGMLGVLFGAVIGFIVTTTRPLDI